MTMSRFWHSKKVLITGHTGFVGSWVTLLFERLGSTVVGYSKSVPTRPSLFEITELGSRVESIEADIRDYDKLSSVLEVHKPEIIVHLAAQPIVKESFESPLSTYSTNVLGTANLLEVIRQLDSEVVLLNMTSDKCYENIGKLRGYTEDDKLGGRDPYSSSKACSDLITHAYRESYFKKNSLQEHGKSICTVRAGNIVGGGDWAKYRLVPDCIRSFEANQTLLLRYPEAVRPWQHVLDVIRGFHLLVVKLIETKGEISGAWNFGPSEACHWSTKDVVEFIASLYGGQPNWEIDDRKQAPEEQLLTLDNTKSKTILGWNPIWDTRKALERTISWYKCYKDNPKKIVDYTNKQIDQYLFESGF